MQMVLHGLFADEHFLRHSLILVAWGHKLDDLAFASAQRRAFTRLAASRRRGFASGSRELAHYSRRGMGIQPDLAPMHLADALDDEVRRGLLQDNARTAELHGLDEFVLV